MKSKTNHNIRYAVFTIALFVAPFAMQSAQAETILQFEDTLAVDALGNAKIEMHMKFDAQQFINWQQRYGMNPSLLRREVGKMLSAYDITDFQIDKNEMNREVTVTIAASGATRNMGDGLVEMDVPKEWRLINQDGPELKFNFIEPLGAGVSIQHHVTVNLPESATDVSELFPAAGGQNRLTYRQPTGSRSSMPLILGIVLAAMGAGVATVGFVVKPKGV